MRATDPINPPALGLDLRTHIAIEAMKALILNADNPILINEIPSVTESAVMVADSLIVKLNHFG
jgi:hypothetical protein